MWDVSPAVWTEAAINSGARVRLEDHEDVADLFAEGLLTSGGTGPPNASLEGLRSLPGISNCPVVIEFDDEGRGMSEDKRQDEKRQDDKRARKP